MMVTTYNSTALRINGKCRYRIFANPLTNLRVSFQKRALSIATYERNFLCYKGVLQHQRPWWPYHIQVSYTLPGTRPRFFINDHNAQIHCIKGKWHDRRHLYFVILFGSEYFCIWSSDTKWPMFLRIMFPFFFFFFFFRLLTCTNPNILMGAK